MMGGQKGAAEMTAITWRRLLLSRIAAPSSLSCFGMQAGSSRAAAAPRVFKQHCAHRAMSSAKPSGQPTAIRPELSNYEQALRKAAAQKPQDGAEEDSVLPRVKMERFLRNQRTPSANFIYKEKRDKPNLHPSQVICLVKAAGRIAEGKGQSRFDATQQACHQWLQDYQNLHMTDRREMQKLRPRVRTPLAIYAPPDAPWHDLPSSIKKLTAAKSPWLAPVPGLEHGLASVLHNDNSKATPIWANLGGKPASAYVRTIVQPKDINWNGIAPFTPPSFDDTLHALALKHKSKYKASTSSITGLLSHVYQVISNFRPADTSQLSAAFKNEPNSFSYSIMKKPVAAILRAKDGVFGIDSHKDEKQDNKILIDLGKSMERMLTMPENEFKSLMLKPLHVKGKGEGEEGSADEAVASVEAVDTVGGKMKSRPAGSELEGGGGGAAAAAAAALAAATPDDFLLGAYNFSKSHGFMLRSQLDCIYGDKQIFDIKTRATHAIRNCFNLLPDIPAHERHLHFVDYKITQQTGLWNSFEREQYDMIRAAFIKYAGQCRIGRMDGAFVTYHNTQEIFGFQYVPLATMDQLVYGSTHMATLHFDQGLKMLGILFDHLTNLKKGSDDPIHVSLCPQQAGRCMRVEVRTVISETSCPPTEPGLDSQNDVKLGDLDVWYLFVETYVNGKLELKPWDIAKTDLFEVKYRLVAAESCISSHNGAPGDAQFVKKHDKKRKSTSGR